MDPVDIASSSQSGDRCDEETLDILVDPSFEDESDSRLSDVEMSVIEL